MVDIEWRDGARLLRVATASARTLTVYGGAGGLASLQPIVADYTRLGVEHILTGFDHLLFVVALTLLVRQAAAAAGHDHRLHGRPQPDASPPRCSGWSRVPSRARRGDDRAVDRARVRGVPAPGRLAHAARAVGWSPSRSACCTGSGFASALLEHRRARAARAGRALLLQRRRRAGPARGDRRRPRPSAALATRLRLGARLDARAGVIYAMGGLAAFWSLDRGRRRSSASERLRRRA